MSSLVVMASVFALAGGGALLLRRRLEEALPLSVVLIVGVQYAFGLFGWLSAGFYAALALSVLSKSMAPCAEQNRSRVSAFTMTRRRSVPVRSSLQRLGVLPYIVCRKSARSFARNAA